MCLYAAMFGGQCVSDGASCLHGLGLSDKLLVKPQAASASEDLHSHQWTVLAFSAVETGCSSMLDLWQAAQ